MMYKVKNRLPQDLWINLPDPARENRLLNSVRLPPRGSALLTEEQYQSTDVQAKIRQEVLSVTPSN